MKIYQSNYIESTESYLNYLFIIDHGLILETRATRISFGGKEYIPLLPGTDILIGEFK